MAFLKNLFKAKPGGTMVGNLLRGVSKTVVNAVVPGAGALVGNGAMIPTQEAYDIKNLSDADYQAKYGVTKTGAPVPGVTPNPNIMTIDQRAQLAQQPGYEAAAKKSFGELAKKFWWVGVVAIAAIGGVIALFRRKGKRR